LIVGAMVLSIAVGLLLGFVGSRGYWLAVVLIVVYGMIIWLDSSSLTAGAAGSADPARRGATLAVHSMLGYAGGFVGPLAIGWTLDLSGGMSPLGWGLSFAVIAALMAVALIAFTLLRPRELEGDRTG
jgi:MFS family permease